MSDCALYYGWYAGNVAGPFSQPGFKFVPGAIAAHIHSYSAATLRDEPSFKPGGSALRSFRLRLPPYVWMVLTVF